MKLINYLLIAILLISSCKEDDAIDAPELSDDYGRGMYVVTDFGVSYLDYIDPNALIVENVFKKVNSTTIVNPKRIKFHNSKAYILGNRIYIADLATFGAESEISGFNNAVDFDFVGYNRLFVIDKGDAHVKVIDLNNMEITTEIETGDSTRPVFIVSNSYKSFVLNGGGVATQTKDSTVVVIEYRDNLVPLADFTGNLLVGDNPNSAVFAGNLKVLCKGVYDSINSVNNTESSLSDVNQYSNQVYSTNILTGIYNAQNLISNWDNSSCYLTAEGGVYRLNPNTLNVNLLVSVNASVISTITESYADSDTTVAYSEMLYMNDLDNPNTIYKYSFSLLSFTDTIIVDGAVKDIAFY
jgi:hypothetical protein